MTSSDMRQPTVLDLFCGAGGLSGGLVKSGWRVLGAVDSWGPAVRTYERNFSHPVRQLDLATADAESLCRSLGIEGETIDLVVGGPPCQGFSIQRIGPDSDHRNELVLTFARLVADLRPQLFLMENVPGLLGARGRATAARFEEMLDGSGYDLDRILVNAADYGVPQSRRRVFYVGWLAGEIPTFVFPSPTASMDQRRSVMDAIGDLPSPPADGSPTPGDPLHRRTRLSEINLARLRYIPPGGGFESLPPALRVRAHQRGASAIGHRFVYGRLDPMTPASTITARFDSFTRGRFAHPFEDRNITLREGARLQTFPDEFQFVGTQEEIAALVGNAVPPLLAEIVGHALLDHLLSMAGRESVARPRQLQLIPAAEP
jgi:DNA (cytosine-5)-methyltransferase 1